MLTKLSLVLMVSLMITVVGCDVSFMGDEIGAGTGDPNGGGGNPGGNNDPQELTVNGDVGSGVTNSFIIVTTANGTTAWSGASSSSSDYAATMSVMATDFPLISRASGGSDMISGFSPDFDMRSTVLSATTTVGNINPFSTLISATADKQSLGINNSSIASATQVILKQLNFGLDTARISDPVTSPVQNSNVATLFRSNEALAEMIRRTCKALLVAGFSLSADQVIAHLSGDLTDGVIDGRGIGSDARVAATSSLVGAQIVLETMTNDLQVGGFDAEGRIDSAISMTHPGAIVMTGDLTVTKDMIAQAAVTTAAAYDLSPTAENAALFDAASAMPEGASVSSARQILPSNSSASLRAAIAKAASGSGNDHEVVNSRLRFGVDGDVVDRTAPLISLVGSSMVPLTVGGSYIERGATATDDRDGDLSSMIVIDNQSVDTSATGDYFVTYNVSDFTGNAADEVVRTVSVSNPAAPDTVAPVISLLGSNPLNLDQGDTYVEPGATASDNVDGDLTSSIAIDSSAVATSTAGNYSVTYNVSDSSGNAANEATRSVVVSSVQVVDTDPPVITLLGSNPLTLIEGNSYNEPGATAFDDVDGDITTRISIDSSNVNTSQAGNYTVTYDVSDTAGNAAIQAMRTVTVQSAGNNTGNAWEAVLSEMVGYAAYNGVTGGAGKPLLTVTNLNNSGAGSLRQALSNASSNGGAWIRFSAGLTGTINLGSPINMVANTTVDGRGANITLQGPGGSSSTINARRGAFNFILMYMKLIGPYGTNNDLMQVDNTASFGPNDSNLTERFWVYHVTFDNSEDELFSIRRTYGKYSVQDSHFIQRSGSGYGNLLTNVSDRLSEWDAVQQIGTWTRNFWQGTGARFERAPRISLPSNQHLYNNYVDGFWGTAVFVVGHGTVRAEALLENNVVHRNASGASVNYTKYAQSGYTNGRIKATGNWLMSDEVVTQNEASQVFSPPYQYSLETANSVLRSEIMSGAGWQNVPFPE